jgi:ferredoxin
MRKLPNQKAAKLCNGLPVEVTVETRRAGPEITCFIASVTDSQPLRSQIGMTRQSPLRGNTRFAHSSNGWGRRSVLRMSWAPPGSTQKVKITVYEKGKGEPRVLEAPVGSNLRKVLLENKVDVYTLRGKLTNCGGGGQCGTCIVDIIDGQLNTNPRGWRETRIFENKKSPETWRLSCCTKVEGPITLRTKPE